MTRKDIHRWLVFASACSVMVVPMGFFYSLGALFVPFMTEFNVSRTKASLIQSVAIAVSLSTGFVHGLLMHRFGMVKTGLAGATLASLGLAVSYFATSIAFLVVTIGIATSMGCICMYIVCSAAVGRYFSGKQSLILLSLVNSCSGIGGMVFPFILTFLNDSFYLRGTLLVCAGLVMNTIPGAFLWTKPQRRCTSMGQAKEKPVEQIGSLFTVKREYNGYSKKKNRPAISQNMHQNNIYILHKETRCEKDNNNPVELLSVRHAESWPGYYFQAIAGISYDGTPETAVRKRENMHGISQDQNQNIRGKHTTLAESVKYLASNRSYIFFIVGLAFCYPPIMVLITFIADAFKDSGLSTDDANIGLLLLNICGIIGRLLPGILMQFRYIKTMFVPVLASIIAAGSMTGLILTDSLHLKLLFSSLSGISYGMFVPSFSVTILDIVGVDHLGNAIGFAFTCNGLANIAAGPVSGYIRDSTGSYLVVFLLASGVQLVAVLMFAIAQVFLSSNKIGVTSSQSTLYVTNVSVEANQEL